MKSISSNSNFFFAGLAGYVLCGFLTVAATAADVKSTENKPVANKIEVVNPVAADTTKPLLNTDSVTATSDSNLALNSPEASSPVNISPVNISPVVTNSKTPPTPQKINSTSQLASLLGGLAIILVLIFGLSKFIKHFSQGGFMQNPTIKMLSAMPLGTRERLMLIDVGGKQMLLGITATQINTLHVFDEPVVEADKAAPSSDFSKKLMEILQQKNLLQSNKPSQKNSKFQG